MTRTTSRRELAVRPAPSTTALPIRASSRHTTVRYQRVAPRALSLALYSAFAGGVASFVLPATLAWANPQGQQVVRGAANFQTNGNTLTVTNTPGAAINWQSFSIQKNETTHFQQANSASSVLNRVVANNPSELLGNLTSNGKVVLINPFGITVGRGAAVDTAGFTASTLNITDADWANGKLRFKGNSLSGDVKIDGIIRSSNGDVVLFAPNVSVGSEALVKAENGNVIIGAGQQVEITGRGLEGIRFQIQSADNKAVNLGKIEGNAIGVFAGTLRHSGSILAQTAAMEGGKVVLRAIKDVEVSAGARINADGGAGKAGGQISIASASGDILVGNGVQITANGGVGAAGGAIGITAAQGRLTVEPNAYISATGSPGGSIRLMSAAETRVAGVVTAASPVRADSPTDIQPISLATGGKVEVLGKQVSLEAGAMLDVSGDGGGGTILVGGDFQGRNPDIPNAQNTSVAPGVVLSADGRAYGDGGKVIVWADDDTHFSGTISAQGGALGGNGGFAETSGKKNLYYRGRTNLAAPRGRVGTLLLDPDEIIIQGGTGDGDDADGGFQSTLNNGTVGTVAAGASPSTFTIYESEIEGTNANILLQAANKIFVTGSFSGGELAILTNGNLTLEVTNATNPGHGIDLTSSNDGYNFAVRTAGTGSITLNTTSSNNQGQVLTGQLVTDGGAVNINAQGIVQVNRHGTTGQGISTGAFGTGGNVTISSRGDMSLFGDIVTYSTLSTIGGAVSLTGVAGISSGNVNVNGTIATFGGNVTATGNTVSTLSGTTSGRIDAGTGNITLTGTSTVTGLFSGGIGVDFGTSMSGASLSFTGDRFYVHSSAGTIQATNSISITPFSAAKEIMLGNGDDSIGTSFVGISQSDVSRLSTPVLRIGKTSNTGDINFDGTLSMPGGTLSLLTGGAIAQGIGQQVTASALRAEGGSINLFAQNVVTTFAGKSSTFLLYRGTGSFTVGAVDSLTKTSSGDVGDDITLIAVAGGSTITLSSDIETIGGDIALSSDYVKIATPTVNLRSNSDGLGDSGGVSLGILTADAAGRSLVVNAATSESGKDGGNVSFNGAGNIGGAYLKGLDINAQSGSGGLQATVYLSGNIELTAGGTGAANQATLAIRNAHLRVDTSTTLNTNTAAATLTAGGLIDLGSARVGGTSNHATLTASANGGSNGNGGTVKLGEVAAYSDWLGGVSASALGNGSGSVGQIQLFDDITVTRNTSTLAPSTGNVSLSGNVVVHSGAVISTGPDTASTGGGNVTISGGSISANSKGLYLSIDTASANGTSASASGSVILPTVDNAGGAYLKDLYIYTLAPVAGTSGDVTLNGNILLDRGNATDGDEAGLTILARYINLNKGAGTFTIDTLQEAIGSGGSVQLVAQGISASTAGVDLKIDTSTPDNFASRFGGSISLAALISSTGIGTFAPQSVELNASSASVSVLNRGTISLNRDILVADGGYIKLNGTVALGSSITLGSDSGAGTVDVEIKGSVETGISSSGLTIQGGASGVADLSQADVGLVLLLDGEVPMFLDVTADEVSLWHVATTSDITVLGHNNVTLSGSLDSKGGDIQVTATAGTLSVMGNVLSTGVDDFGTVGQAGGSITLVAVAGSVALANNVEVGSTGANGANEFNGGGTADDGGDGGAVSVVAGGTLTLGNNVSIFSQGGKGGGGFSTSDDGAHGGWGGAGGHVTVTAGAGTLTVGTTSTIASRGGAGGIGANGGVGGSGVNAFSSTPAGDGDTGYLGGDGGGGGDGGNVRVSAPAMVVIGTIFSEGGMGGNAGQGGEGGQGGMGFDDGFFTHSSGSGGLGGDAGYAGWGGGSGSVSVSSGSAGALSINGTTVASRSGAGGLGALGGAGGQAGPTMGAGASGGIGAAGNGSGDAGADEPGSLFLNSLSGKGMSLVNSYLSGKEVHLQSTGGTADLSMQGVDILAEDGASLLALGGSILMDNLSTITLTSYGLGYNSISLTSDTGVQLAALAAPYMYVTAPTIYTAPGFAGDHLTGEVGILGSASVKANIGTMADRIKVDLTGELDIHGESQIWIESANSLSLNAVHTHVASGTGTVHVHSGGSLSTVTGLSGNVGAGNVSVYLSGDSGVDIGGGTSVEATGTGILELVGGSSSVNVDGTVISASGSITASGGSVNVGPTGTVTSATGRISVTADSISMDGKLDTGNTGIAVVLVTDDFDFGGTITAASGTVALMPKTAGLDIDVAASGFNPPPTSLLMVIEDSYFITAGAIQLGNADMSGGDVTFHDAYNPSGSRTLAVYGANITQNSGALLNLNGLMAKASGAVELTRSGNNITTVAGRSGVGSDFRVTSSGNLTVSTVAGVSGIDAGGGAADSAVGLGSEGGGIFISGVSVRGTGGTLPVGVYIKADYLDIDATGTINAGGTGFAINPYSAGRLLDLGGIPGDGEFLLTGTELTRIENYNAFYAGNPLGGNAFGDIDIGSAVNFATAGLVFHATGTMSQGANALTAGGLYVEAGSVQLGTASNSLSTGHLSGKATAGNFEFKSAGTIKIAAAGIAASGGVSLHSVSGSIINDTFSGQQVIGNGGYVSLNAATGVGQTGGDGPLSVRATGQLTLATGSGDAWIFSDQNLTLASAGSDAGTSSINIATTGTSQDLKIEGASTGNDNWNLQASGNIAFGNSGSISADSANLLATGTITGPGSPGAAALNIAGHLDLTGTTIGAAGVPLWFNANTADATISSGSGGIYMLSVNALSASSFDPTTPAGLNVVDVSSNGILTVDTDIGTDDTLNLRSTTGIHFNQAGGGTYSNGGGQLSLFGPVQSHSNFVFQGPVQHTGSWSLNSGTTEFQGAANNLGSMNVGPGTTLKIGANSTSVSTLSNGSGGTVTLTGGDLQVGTVSTQAGLLDIGTHVLTVGAGNLVNDASGVIEGAGTIVLSGAGASVINNGTITPGTVGTIGTININGGLVQGASGLIKFDWANGATDHLEVVDFTKGGTLSVAESGVPFLGGGDEMFAVHFSGNLTDAPITVNSQTAGITFNAVTTGGANADLKIVTGTVTNNWVTDTNAAESWTTGANWSRGHAPRAQEDAIINVVNNPTITFSSGSHTALSLQLNERLDMTTANSLGIGAGGLSVGAAGTVNLINGVIGGTGAHTFTSGSTLNWSGGTLNGTGTTSILSGATATVLTGGSQALDRPFANAGILNINESLQLFNGVTLSNTGAINLQGINTSNLYGTGLLKNEAGGTVNTTGGGYAWVNLPTDNAGQMTAGGADLYLSGGSSTGKLSISSGRTLYLQASTFNSSGSIANNGGTLVLNSGSTITVGGNYSETAGTVQITGGGLSVINTNLSTANLIQDNGVLTGTGDITAGTFDRSGGYIESTAGTPLLTTTGLVTHTGGGYIANRQWNVQGGFNLTAGELNIEAGGTVINSGGSLMDFSASYFGGALPTVRGAGTLINNGTLRDSSADLLQFTVASLTNNGIVEFGVGSTAMNFASSSTHGSGGTLNIASGMQVVLTGGTHTFAGGSKLINSGTLTTSGGTSAVNGLFSNTGSVAVTGGTLLFNTGSEVQFPNLTLGGNIGGNDALTVTGSAALNGNILAGTGDFKIAGSATGTSATGMSVDARAFDNQGTFTINSGNLMLVSTATVQNSGQFFQAGNSTLQDFCCDAPAGFTNKSGGTYTFSSSETNGIEPAFNNQAGATIQVQSGTARFAGGLTQAGTISLAGGSTLSTDGLSLVSSGLITGTGTIATGAGTLTSNGAMKPGGTGTIGTLTISGNLNMGSGTLDTELAGPASYDAVNVTGNLVKSGTISVSENAVFVAGGQAFDVVTFGGTLTGTLPAVVSSITDVNFSLSAPGSLLRLTADSVTNRWNVAASGFWTTAVNWSRGHTPNQFEDAVIDRTGANTVTINTAGAQAKSLQVLGDDRLDIFGASNGLALGAGASSVSQLSVTAGTLALGTGDLSLGSLAMAGGLLASAGGTVAHSGNATFNTAAAVSAPFNSTGTLGVSGTGVTFSGGGSLTGPGAAINLSGGTAINFSGGSFSITDAGISGSGDVFRVSDSAQVGLNGSSTLNTVNLQLDGTSGMSPTLTLDNVAGLNLVGTYNQSGSTSVLAGNALLEVNGSFTWSGGTMSGTGTTRVNVSGTSDITLAQSTTLSRTLQNQNELSISGFSPLTIGSTGTLLNDNGATLYLNPQGTVAIASGGSGSRLANNGIIEYDALFAPSSTSAIAVQLDNNAAGELRILSGTLNLTGTLSANAGRISLVDGTSQLGTAARSYTNNGNIDGIGTLNVGSGTLTNAGNISPGEAGTVGTLTVAGNYAQAGGGILSIRAASSSTADRLEVTGSATLDGTLAVGTLGGYTLTNGDTYTIVNTAGLSGSFSVVNGPGGITLVPQYLPIGAETYVTLSASGGAANNWIGTDGDWNNTANWSLGRVPVVGEVVTINPAGAHTITLSTAANSLSSLSLSHTDDIFLFSTGGTLTLPSSATLNGTIYIGGGTLTNANAGQTANTIILASGQLANSGTLSVSTMTLAGGEVAGSGILNLPGLFSWTSGTFNGGTLNTSGNTTLTSGTHVLFDALWANTGTVTHSGGAFSLTDSIFSNQQVFINTATGSDLFYSASGSNLVHNTGTFNWSQAGTRDSGLTTFNNDGVVNVNAGATANMQSGGSGAGPWVAASGATLQFSGGTRFMDPGANVVGAGTMLVNGGIVYVDGAFGIAGSGTIAMNSGELYLNTGSPVSFAHGVTLSSAATLDLASDTTFQDNLTVNGSEVTGLVNKTVDGLLTLNDGAVTGGTLTTNGGASLLGTSQVVSNLTWFNPGTISHTSGTLHLNNSSTLVNQAGGVISETGNGGVQAVAVTVSSGANGYIENAGTINWNVAGSRGILGDVGLNNTGTINVTGGTLNMAGTAGFGQSGTLLIGAGTSFQRPAGFNNSGYIAGTGTIDLVGGTLTNMGTISPGGEGAAGTLSINGHFNMSTGLLLAELAGAGVYDKVVVSGNLATGGTIEVSELNTFVAGGDAFNVVTYGGTLSAGSPMAVSNIADVSSFLISSGAGNFTLTADGVTNYWMDGITGNWTTGANWTRGHAPNSLEDVVIDPTGVQTVTVDSGLQAARSVQLPGDDTLAISGGSLDIGAMSTLGTSSALVLSAGSLQGAGDLDIGGNFFWTGGTVTGSGGFATSGQATLSGVGAQILDGRNWANTGTIAFNGGNLQLNGGNLDNKPGATFNVGITVGALDGISGSGTLTNNGGATFNVTAATTAFDVTMGSFFVNNGTVNVDASLLDLERGVTHQGDFIVASGAALRVRNNEAHTFDSSSSISGAGYFEIFDNPTVSIAGGYSIAETRISGGQLQFNGSGPYMLGTLAIANGGTLGGSANVAVSGAFGWSAGTVTGAATLSTAGTTTLGGTVSLNGRVWNNTGFIDIGSGDLLQLSGNAQINNQAGGTLSVVSVAQQLISAGAGGGGINNAGLFTMTNSAIATGGGNISNSGQFNASGLLDLGGGTLSNSGTLRPGGSGVVSQLNVTGNADLTGGTVQIDLAGAGSYDLLAISGNLVKGGTLSVSESTPFIAGGDTFNVVTHGGTASGTDPVLSAAITDVTLTLATPPGNLQLVAAAVTNRWQDGISGSWTTGTNWTRGHAPNSLEDALINPTGIQTITLSGTTQTPRSLQLTGDDTLAITGGTLNLGNASTVGSSAALLLSFGDITGAGALDIAGVLNWSGGAIGGTGTLGTSGAVMLSGSGAKTLNDRAWNAGSGTVNYTGGSVFIYGTSGALNLGSGATFNVATADGVGSDIRGTGAFNAMGGSVVNMNAPAGSNSIYTSTVNLSGTTNLLNGEMDFDREGSGSIINLAGTLNMSNGTRIKGYSTLGGGVVTLNLIAGAAINVSSGTATLDMNNWDLNVNTPISLPAALIVNQSGNTLTANQPLTIGGAYTLSGGTLAGTGGVTLNGAFNWGGGTVTGSGALASSGVSTLGNTVALDGKAWNNSGVISIGGATTLLLNNGAQLSNQAGGTLSVANTGGQGIGNSAGSGSIANAGLLVLANSTIATGGGNLSNSGIFEGSGLLNLGSGTLSNTGALKPGGMGGVGTLSVTGNADLSGGTLYAELFSSSSYDRLAVSSNLKSGGTIAFSENTPFMSGSDVFDVATYGGSVSGSLPALSGSIAGVTMGVSTTAAAGGAVRLAPTSVTNTWLSGSGDWTDSIKWSRGHAPTSGEAITVSPTGAQTVTIASGASGLASLTLGSDDTFLLTGGNFVLPGSSSLPGTLALAGGTLTNSGSTLSAGAVNWQSGVIGGSGMLFAPVSLAGAGARSLTGGTIIAASGPSLAGGSLSLQGGQFNWSSGTLTVGSGALLDINGGGIGSGAFVNQGSVQVGSSAAALTTLGATGSQSGSFDIASGKTLSLGSGNSTLASGAAVTGGVWAVNAGQVTVAGTLNRGAGAATQVSGGTLTVGGALTTGTLAVTGGFLGGAGDLTVTDAFSQSGGAIGTGFDELSITQQSGNLSVGSFAANSVTLAASNGSIVDGNGAGNNVTATSIKLTAMNGIDLDTNTAKLNATLSSTGAIDIENAGALELTGLAAASGSATFRVGGPLTQTGAVQVLGPVSIDSGGAGVTLGHAGNQFDGTISLVNTGATSIVDNAGLSVAGSAAGLTLNSQDVTLGSLMVSGPLTITASGQISQGAAINVTGLTSLNTAANVVLNAASTYTGGVTFNTTGSVTLASSAGLVVAGTANTVGGNLTMTAAGPVTQSAAMTVTGQTAVLASGQAIDFSTQANDFSQFTYNGATVSVKDLNTIALGGSATGLVAVTAGSGVNSTGTLGAGSLDITLSGAGSASVIADVSGAANFAVSGGGSYQDITYVNASATGTLGSPILASGAVALIFGNTGLDLPQVQAATLTVSAGGAITQSGPITTGASNFFAPGFDVTLGNTSNQMGAVRLHANNASITDAGTVGLDGTVSGALQVNAAAINQGVTSTLSTGSATLSASSGIAMVGANLLGTLAASSSGAITVNDLGASLTLGPISTPGSLAVQSGGALLGSGAMVSAGTSLDLVALSIGTSAQPLEFSAPVVQLFGVAGDVHAHSPQAFALAGLGAAGDANVSSAQALSVTGPAFANGVLSLTSQGMTVQAGIDADTVSLDAGTGALSLGNGSSAVGVYGVSAVSLIGNDITLLGGSADHALVEVVSDGGISVNAAGNFVIHGGAGTGALAQVSSFGPLSITVGGVVDVLGGVGTGAYAKLDPAVHSLLSVSAQSVNLQGGSGAGAYAAIVSEGDVTVTAPGGITLTPGSGADADAVVVSYFGKVTLPTCNGCVKLNTPPFGNGVAEAGVLGGEEYLAILTQSTIGGTELVKFSELLTALVEPPATDPKEKKKEAIVVEGEAKVCN